MFIRKKKRTRGTRLGRTRGPPLEKREDTRVEGKGIIGGMNKEIDLGDGETAQYLSKGSGTIGDRLVGPVPDITAGGKGPLLNTMLTKNIHSVLKFYIASGPEKRRARRGRGASLLHDDNTLPPSSNRISVALIPTGVPLL